MPLLVGLIDIIATTVIVVVIVGASLVVGFKHAADEVSDMLAGKKPVDDYWRKRGVK